MRYAPEIRKSNGQISDHMKSAVLLFGSLLCIVIGSWFSKYFMESAIMGGTLAAGVMFGAYYLLDDFQHRARTQDKGSADSGTVIVQCSSRAAALAFIAYMAWRYFR